MMSLAAVVLLLFAATTFAQVPLYGDCQTDAECSSGYCYATSAQCTPESCPYQNVCFYAGYQS